MSDMMLAQTNTAATHSQVKQTANKNCADTRNSTEISEGSDSFSKALQNQVEGSTPSQASREQQNTESPTQDETAISATGLAADGNGLPAELLEVLPEELIELLDGLPEDVMDQIVAQFNASVNPQMAIPAQQKVLVREIQSVLKQLPDMARPALDALKMLPDVLKSAEQHASDKGLEQLKQIKDMLSGMGDDLSSKTRSAFQQLAAQLLRPAVNSAATGTERPVLPESALAALNAVQTEGLQTQAAQRTSTPTSTQLHVPFQQAGWNNELSERVVWMANQKLQSAEIKMNPPHLGPIEVRLNISGDQAQVQFSAPHGVVRDALESALPRLREMFGAQGMNLVDVNVSDQSGADKRRSADASADGRKQGAFNDSLQDMDEDDATLTGVSMLNGSTPAGAIDYFV